MRATSRLAISRRSTVTLEYVRNAIEKINNDAGELRVTSERSYKSNYLSDKLLIRNINEYFSDVEKFEFIAEYAKEINADKELITLWDALLRRPLITLTYIQDEIQRINSDGFEELITGSESYIENYKLGKYLPCSINSSFTKLEKDEFIAQYGKEIGRDKNTINIWDALLRRPIENVTLGCVRDGIVHINDNIEGALITGSSSYSKYYRSVKFLPCSVISFFSKLERAKFIVEYAEEMGVDKEHVKLWDALLRRPVANLSLVYVRDTIVKINSNASKILIRCASSYAAHYRLGKNLPSDITGAFSVSKRDKFIAKYAKKMNVDKKNVKLWDALLMRPVLNVTLEYIRNTIEKINDESGYALFTGSDTYADNYKQGECFPSCVNSHFTMPQKTAFIAEYAKKMNVDKDLVNLWDALIQRPILTLEYIRDSIVKINDVDELIASSASYRKHHKLNKYLPREVTLFFTASRQEEFIANYAKEINLDKESLGLWDALLPQRKIRYTIESIAISYPKWYRYFFKYMENQNNISQKERAFKNFIQYFIGEFNYSSNPLIFLSQKRKKINLDEYESFFSFFGEPSKKQFHTVIVDFIDFIIADLSGFDDDTEEDEPPLLSNTFNYFESDILQIRSPKFRESEKPRLAFSYIVKAREWILPEHANNFSDLKHLQSISDNDWIQVDISQINAADLNCVWRYRRKETKSGLHQTKEGGRTFGYVYEMWIPTRWLMLYTLLQVPLRGVQVTKLDSGEADSYLPVINNGEIKWVDNSLKLKSKVKQSFIKRYQNEHAGMYVTTNKTSSSAGGYAVPYIPFELCKWIIQFREFQSTYNPLDKPTLWTEIKLRRKTNEKKLKSMGSQCFLFREMGDVTPMNEAVFRCAFAFVLAQIETKDLKLTKKINDRNVLNSYETVYSPHSLRVSLISAYITDGKIPIEVVSKIVGHHSLMMTIYYTKIGAGQFRYYLEQAEKNMLKASGDKLALELLEKQLESADENLICNTEGGVRQFTMNWPSSSYFISDIGICPMAGTGCNQGGELIESTKTRQLYAPVQQGYLGERNCPRCRFFMTGVAFTPGLAAVMHRIQVECGGVNEKYKEHTINVKILEDEEYDCEQKNVPFPKRLELAKSIQNKETFATKLNAHKVDIVAIARLIEMSLSLVNQSNPKDKLALVTNNDIGKMGIEYNDSSEFQLFDTVCQDSEIYSIVDATNIAPRRTQLIDAMLQANNVSSALFRMPVQEQLEIGNQVTQLLLKRLGSWDKLNSVAEGRLKLNENSTSAVNNSSMKSITKEVQQLIDKAKCSGQQLEVGVAINDDNVINVKDIK